jgi:adenosylcobinamide kinase/adenosylcobinamide-phosphate guanylyltransferase
MLLLGGARSGKSTFAEQLASSHGGRIAYLATAQAYDDEMRERIVHHQADRPQEWRTVECPLDPAAAIRAHAGEADCFLLDCLTLLVSNLLLTDRMTDEEIIRSATDDLLTASQETRTDLIIVSNEVGLGLVPEYPLGRRYRDVLGKVNQRLAAQSTHVYFLIAGIPIDLRSIKAEVGW